MGGLMQADVGDRRDGDVAAVEAGADSLSDLPGFKRLAGSLGQVLPDELGQ
jgi:hypothetical protein